MSRTQLLIYGIYHCTVMVKVITWISAQTDRSKKVLQREWRRRRSTSSPGAKSSTFILTDTPRLKRSQHNLYQLFIVKGGLVRHRCICFYNYSLFLHNSKYESNIYKKTFNTQGVPDMDCMRKIINIHMLGPFKLT